MNASMKPRPTRSTLQNQRIVRAIRANAISEENGLRVAGRRSELPTARKTQTALVAVASGLLAMLLIGLLF